MVNIAEILKDAPAGTKLYSLICGECELNEVKDEKDYPIYVNGNGVVLMFTSEGRFWKDCGECLLFPSKENRDWSTFDVKQEFKEGDFVYRKLNDGSEWISIHYDEENGEPYSFVNYCSDGNGVCKDDAIYINFIPSRLCLCGVVKKERLATEEEKETLLKKLEEKGEDLHEQLDAIWANM